MAAVQHTESHRSPGHQTSVHDGTHTAGFISLSKKPLYFLSPRDQEPQATDVRSGTGRVLPPAPDQAGSSAACAVLHQCADVGSNFLSREKILHSQTSA